MNTSFLTDLNPGQTKTTASGPGNHDGGAEFDSLLEEQGWFAPATPEIPALPLEPGSGTNQFFAPVPRDFAPVIGGDTARETFPIASNELIATAGTTPIKVTIAPGPGALDTIPKSTYANTPATHEQPVQQVVQAGASAETVSVSGLRSNVLVDRTQEALIAPEGPPLGVGTFKAKGVESPIPTVVGANIGHAMPDPIEPNIDRLPQGAQPVLNGQVQHIANQSPKSEVKVNAQSDLAVYQNMEPGIIGGAAKPKMENPKVMVPVASSGSAAPFGIAADQTPLSQPTTTISQPVQDITDTRISRLPVGIVEGKSPLILPPQSDEKILEIKDASKPTGTPLELKAPIYQDRGAPLDLGQVGLPLPRQDNPDHKPMVLAQAQEAVRRIEAVDPVSDAAIPTQENPKTPAGAAQTGAAPIGPTAPLDKRIEANDVWPPVFPSDAPVPSRDSQIHVQYPHTPSPAPTAPGDHGMRAVHAIAQAAHALQDRPVELLLNPEELGRVKLTLHHGDGSMSVSIAAERPETMHLLRRHIDLLADQLRDIGYQDLTFDFSSNDNQDPGPNNEEIHGEGAEQNATLPDKQSLQGSPVSLTIDPNAAIDIRL